MPIGRIISNCHDARKLSSANIPYGITFPVTSGPIAVPPFYVDSSLIPASLLILPVRPKTVTFARPARDLGGGNSEMKDDIARLNNRDDPNFPPDESKRSYL